MRNATHLPSSRKGDIVLVDLAELGRYHGIDDSAMLLDVCRTNCQILARVYAKKYV